ncbi:MAG: hypothetical protein AB7F65_02035 [Dehalococcoidia bacterium]
MAIQVYRCSQCGREVLVRLVAPLTPEQVRKRIEEEMRPEQPGPPGGRGISDRLRDDIWLGVSGGRNTSVPREQVPDRCPSCGQPALALDRTLDG